MQPFPLFPSQGDDADPDNFKPLQRACHEMLCSATVDFVSIFEQARQMTVTDSISLPPTYRNKNYMADTMNGIVVGLLKDNYGSLVFHDEYQRPYLYLAHNTRVYPKKLDAKKFTPFNQPTDHVRKLNAQSLFAGGEDKITIYFAGYVVNGEDWSRLTETRLSYVNSAFLSAPAEWTLDLRDPRYRKNQPLSKPLGAAPQQPVDIIIKGKGEEGKGRIAL